MWKTWKIYTLRFRWILTNDKSFERYELDPVIGIGFLQPIGFIGIDKRKLLSLTCLNKS